ncbi:H-NS histone family protein [Hyphomicrobium sp. CS1GBMeth3]|uniref:H-NS histone family protein n=1 Tax=Hyphomicrobium sp. CS1GBMeth3 TaxID=1892845 RepID=UPI0009307A14|nr:H-NS histone family protein [Hyphomicrobium sp. CS1GBMeth3]
MATVALGRMSLKERRSLRERVDDEIAERERVERAELKAKLSDMASKAGFSVNELFGRGGRRSQSTVQYRNPDDPSQTWTGRGRRPNWIIEAGGNVERFRI